VAFAVLPDMEQELVTYLAAHASLTPLVDDRVSTELATELACLQVTALGGTQPWPWEAVVEFALSAWGGTGDTAKAEANLLARTAAAVAYDLVGTAVTGGHVTGAAVRLAPLWSPDEETNRPRYRCDVAFTVYPA
jgi:hypothetical protein